MILLVITKMICVFFLLAIVTASPIKKTPHWESVCGTSLLFSEDAKTWDEARSLCELIGGHLVDITSLQMNSCILSHYHQKGLPSGVWYHSGNDIKEEGVWRYNTYGDLINWTPIWASVYPEPNGGRSENCLVVNLFNDANAGKWGDYGCNRVTRYICEK